MFTQLAMVVGRVTPQHIQLLGSAFLISSDGKFVTTKHVIGDNHAGLVILAPHVQNINDYQDVSDHSCQPINAAVIEIDPIKDLAVLQTQVTLAKAPPQIGTLDEINIGEPLGIFGFPHCVDGRRVLTFQQTELGAKILLESSGIKVKHAVINTQSRPGQSGSMVFCPRISKIIGVLIGTYAPQFGAIINGINPAELNQTTHVISAEYVKDML